MSFLGHVILLMAGGVTATALHGLEWAYLGDCSWGENSKEMLASSKLSLWTRDQLLEGAEEGW